MPAQTQRETNTQRTHITNHHNTITQYLNSPQPTQAALVSGAKSAPPSFPDTVLRLLKQKGVEVLLNDKATGVPTVRTCVRVCVCVCVRGR
jgi:hypothetical protein